MSRRDLRRPTGAFRLNEMMRLLSAIVLLGIIGLLCVQTRQVKLWSLIANDDSQNMPTVKPGASAASEPEQMEWKETIVEGPTSDDPEEQDDAKADFPALFDKQDILAEEMPSYWRLLRWTQAESTESLHARSRNDLVYTHLAQDPEKYRGTLVSLRLHLKRVLRHDAPQNSDNLGKVFEAWGTTKESGSNPYVVIFPEKQPQLPLGADVFEEAKFEGFFLKLLSYEARDGHKRYAPLLVGRLNWMENPASVALKRQSHDSYWVIGGVLILVLVVFFTQWWGSRDAASSIDLVGLAAKEEAAVDQWIADPDLANDPPPYRERPLDFDLDVHEFDRALTLSTLATAPATQVSDSRTLDSEPRS